MWLFTRYGFYSIACANKPDGQLDPQTLMIRCRQKVHLRDLQTRFPRLADATIISSADRDYRYRFVVPKSEWVAVIAELAEEQMWSNFKDETARFQRGAARAYVHALHDVWGVMYRVQCREEEPE